MAVRRYHKEAPTLSCAQKRLPSVLREDLCATPCHGLASLWLRRLYPCNWITQLICNNNIAQL